MIKCSNKVSPLKTTRHAAGRWPSIDSLKQRNCKPSIIRSWFLTSIDHRLFVQYHKWWTYQRSVVIMPNLSKSYVSRAISFMSELLAPQFLWDKISYILVSVSVLGLAWLNLWTRWERKWVFRERKKYAGTIQINETLFQNDFANSVWFLIRKIDQNHTEQTSGNHRMLQGCPYEKIRTDHDDRLTAFHYPWILHPPTMTRKGMTCFLRTYASSAKLRTLSMLKSLRYSMVWCEAWVVSALKCKSWWWRRDPRRQRFCYSQRCCCCCWPKNRSLLFGFFLHVRKGLISRTC